MNSIEKLDMNNQDGIGLVEILVSLLLLAVAVLGFSTLQMSSLKATDESLKRTQAMSIARGIGENMRVNIANIDTMAQVINDSTQAGTITVDSCQAIDDPCSDEESAIKDALVAIKAANELEVAIGIEDCPETSDSTNPYSTIRCVVVAWDTTNPWTDASGRTGTDDSFINCATATGVYRNETSCIILEAY